MNFKLKPSIVILIGLFSLAGLFLIAGCGGDEKKADTVSAEEGQLWTCGMHPEVIVDEPGQCPKCGMNLVPVKNTQGGKQQAAGQTTTEGEKKERKILYWQAPMNPTEIYDHPGKSAMGMDLIPVYEDEAGLGSGGVVRINPAVVQNMGVRSAEVQRMDFTRKIRTVGKVDYNEDKLYDVNTKISGWVEKLYVNFTGEFVKKGQPLLEIYSPELVTTQEEYLLALKNQQLVEKSSFQAIKEGAETLLESTRKRLYYWDIPESEIKRLEKTREVKKTVMLQAPASGMVAETDVVEGAFVREGTKLFRIADLSSVWVHASIYDYELPWIEEGQRARMELSYLPGKVYTGRVSYIYPYLREKARDIHVRLEFPNPNLNLKPGMYVNVELQGRVIPDALVIPSEAVIRSGERTIVFVVRGEGRFEPREIRVGEEGGPENRYVRVLSGLLDGERVVTSAQFMLDSESRLQEAIQKMLSEKTNAGKSSQSQQQDLQKKSMEMPGMGDQNGMDKKKNTDENHNHDKQEHQH